MRKQNIRFHILRAGVRHGSLATSFYTCAMAAKIGAVHEKTDDGTAGYIARSFTIDLNALFRDRGHRIQRIPDSLQQTEMRRASVTQSLQTACRCQRLQWNRFVRRKGLHLRARLVAPGKRSPGEISPPGSAIHCSSERWTERWRVILFRLLTLVIVPSAQSVGGPVFRRMAAPGPNPGQSQSRGHRWWR